jgi:hypothetical protein
MTNPGPTNQTPITGNAAQAGPNQTATGMVLNAIYDAARAATTAMGINNRQIVPPHGVINTGLVNPPPLKTFVYSPEVRVVIAARAGVEWDVSADLVRCTLIRPENSAATFSFTLQNKHLRYTPPFPQVPPFARMDRIVVYMKRINWLQVFSGYLDSIPYIQLYPGEVTFTATCTLKRLMHQWFNPAMPDSVALLDQFGAPGGLLQGDGQLGTDTGLGSIIKRLLVKVGGWAERDVHIQNFPMVFYNMIKDEITRQESINNPAVQQVEQLLLGGDTSPGPGAYAGTSPDAGTPGPTAGAPGAAGWATSAGADAGTAFYVSQIVSACDNRGMGPQVTDNNLGAALNQAGQDGASGSAGSFGTSNDTKAWQQVQQLGSDIQQNNRNSDGAILGVACALVETGGGTAIRNLYNPSVPGSETFPNDGAGTNGSSCGIFQQQNYAEWGTVAQRMNPLQASSMFFAHLNAVQGWRQMDAGQAIQQVQRSGDASGAIYDAAMEQATKLVQAFRTNANAASPAAAVTNGSSVAGATTTVPAAAPSANGSVPAANGATPTGSGPVPAMPVDPQPNSEGAINFVLQQGMGKPYAASTRGPATYDTAGLVSAAFQAVGVYVPTTTSAIRDAVPPVPQEGVQRGDIIAVESDQVGIWMGDGQILEASDPTGVILAPVTKPQGSWAFAGRACQNGGPNPAAPYNPPWTMGPGVPPSALQQQGGTVGTGSNGASEPVARNLFSYMFKGAAMYTELAKKWPSDKVFIDGQPLLQMVSAVCTASLRCFSSAPDGSFMAWYPDYFGVDGKPAVLTLADIELIDVHIDFSDDPLTTHVYVSGDWSMGGANAQYIGWMDTAGVAGVEWPWLYYRLTAFAPSDLDSIAPKEIMQRFGVRPLQHIAAMAGSHQLEFLMACQLFMQKWAEQYQTSVSMTFMPELFPGMRVRLGNHQLDVYVSQVTHVCDYTQGFQTTAVIMAPASPFAKQLMMSVNYATTDTDASGLASWYRAFTETGPLPLASVPGLGP